jgi:hypothetical protein
MTTLLHPFSYFGQLGYTLLMLLVADVHSLRLSLYWRVARAAESLRRFPPIRNAEDVLDFSVLVGGRNG